MKKLNTVGDAINITKATLKSGKNLTATVNDLLLLFKNGKLKYGKKLNPIIEKDLRKRICLEVDDRTFIDVKVMVQSVMSNYNDSQVINFLLLAYLEYNTKKQVENQLKKLK